MNGKTRTRWWVIVGCVSVVGCIGAEGFEDTAQGIDDPLLDMFHRAEGTPRPDLLEPGPHLQAIAHGQAFVMQNAESQAWEHAWHLGNGLGALCALDHRGFELRPRASADACEEPPVIPPLILMDTHCYRGYDVVCSDEAVDLGREEILARVISAFARASASWKSRSDFLELSGADETTELAGEMVRARGERLGALFQQVVQEAASVGLELPYQMELSFRGPYQALTGSPPQAVATARFEHRGP